MVVIVRPPVLPLPRRVLLLHSFTVTVGAKRQRWRPKAASCWSSAGALRASAWGALPIGWSSGASLYDALAGFHAASRRSEIRTTRRGLSHERSRASNRWRCVHGTLFRPFVPVETHLTIDLDWCMESAVGNARSGEIGWVLARGPSHRADASESFTGLPLGQFGERRWISQMGLILCSITSEGWCSAL